MATGMKKKTRRRRAELAEPAHFRLLSTLKDYHECSRTLALSFLLVLPLLVLYEVGIVLLQAPVGSGAGIEVRFLFDRAFGTKSALVFNALIAAGFLGAFVYLKWNDAVRLDVWPLLMLESTAYALVLGYAVPMIASSLPVVNAVGAHTDSVALRLVLSIGAGVYEEILFRLGLMSALYALAMLLVPEHGRIASPVIVLVSAVLFSACHHVVMGNEPFAAYEFLYRFLFGVALSAVYLYRGLGAAVYTHAIYDTIVTLRFGL